MHIMLEHSVPLTSQVHYDKSFVPEYGTYFLRFGSCFYTLCASISTIKNKRVRFLCLKMIFFFFDRNRSYYLAFYSIIVKALFIFCLSLYIYLFY